MSSFEKKIENGIKLVFVFGTDTHTACYLMVDNYAVLETAKKISMNKEALGTFPDSYGELYNPYPTEIWGSWFNKEGVHPLLSYRKWSPYGPQQWK